MPLFVCDNLFYYQKDEMKNEEKCRDGHINYIPLNFITSATFTN